MKDLLHSLGAPVRAIWGAFPFTHEGRQTLIYLVFSASGVPLTGILWWAMHRAADAQQWAIFGRIADYVCLALLVTVIALGIYTGIRSIKIGPGGVEATRMDDAPPSVTTKTTTTTELNR